ncbi:hypothetical protein HK098_006916 [Nowakowskiella sp. JEL0407]|nr:hypothetical protein HK098_006916 [Nowakowskiella sp. JEL0407]
MSKDTIRCTADSQEIHEIAKDRLQRCLCSMISPYCIRSAKHITNTAPAHDSSFSARLEVARSEIDLKLLILIDIAAFRIIVSVWDVSKYDRTAKRLFKKYLTSGGEID